MKNFYRSKCGLTALMLSCLFYGTSCSMLNFEDDKEKSEEEPLPHILPEGNGANPFAGKIYISDTDTKYIFSDSEAMCYINVSENDEAENWMPECRYIYSYNSTKGHLYLQTTGIFENNKEYKTSDSYGKLCMEFFKSEFGDEKLTDTAKNHILSQSEKTFNTYKTYECKFTDENQKVSINCSPSGKFRSSSSDNYYGFDSIYFYDFFGDCFHFKNKLTGKEFYFIPLFDGTNFSGTVVCGDDYTYAGEIKGQYSSTIFTYDNSVTATSTFNFIELPDELSDITSSKIKLNFYSSENLSLSLLSE